MTKRAITVRGDRFKSLLSHWFPHLIPLRLVKRSNHIPMCTADTCDAIQFENSAINRFIAH